MFKGPADSNKSPGIVAVSRSRSKIQCKIRPVVRRRHWRLRRIAIQNLGTAPSRLEIMLEHLGLRWGYVFLRASSYLAKDDVIQLMNQAVEMYLRGEDERNVKGSSIISNRLGAVPKF